MSIILASKRQHRAVMRYISGWKAWVKSKGREGMKPPREMYAPHRPYAPMMHDTGCPNVLCRCQGGMRSALLD